MLFHSITNDDLISRLNPLIKILLLLTTAVFAFLVSNISFLLIYLFIILTIVRLSKIKFGKALIIIKLFILGIPMLITIFVLSYLWKEQTYTEGILVGIREGIAYALRFLNLVLINFLVVLCTDSREILNTLRAVKIPEIISQIISHIINLLPRLIQELKYIIEAQTLRGMQWKGMWRPSNWMPITLPIILAAIRYSEQSAISLELRCGLNNHYYRLPKFKIADWGVAITCALIIAFSIMQYSFPSDL
ncbi:energy-coupling factor transporter transmembrane component T family protein [candidate division KSB1 bacterium]